MVGEVQEGDLLAGKYRIERKIGEGGMGRVVVARHLELDERVAIKFLLPQALSEPEAVMRFAREARASVKIKSEHVARTLDVGKLENGAPYMVMEYLQGADLGARLRQLGPLPIEQAVDFMLQACHALADAHAIGIIHRDIKPSNLFVIRKSDGQESIKVLDFGISKLTGVATDGTDLGMTRTQTIMGSPYYMSPEQMASSRNVDAATDIWALGITLHELLAGQPPFRGETVTELCSKVLTQPIPRLREWRPDAPDGLQAVLDRCLEKVPSNRYSNVAELATALAAFGTDRGRLAAEATQRVLHAAGISMTTVALPPSPDAAPTAPTQSIMGLVAPLSHSHSQTKRRTGLWVGLAAAVLTIAAVAAVVIKMCAHEPQTTVTAAATFAMPSAARATAPSAPETVSAAPSAPETAALVVPAASTLSPAELLTKQPTVAMPDKSNKSGLGRKDIKEKPGGATVSVVPDTVAPAKTSQDLKSNPKPPDLTDFGGRTR